MSGGALAEFELALRSCIEIDAPPRAVWPHLWAPQPWKPSVVAIERLAGEPGAVGETLRVGQRPADVTVYTILRTLEVEPAAWKVQSLHTEDGAATVGYVTYTLQPTGERTWLCCELLARCRVPLPPGVPDAESFARIARDSTRAKLDADHAALKRLVENGTARAEPAGAS